MMLAPASDRSLRNCNRSVIRVVSSDCRQKPCMSTAVDNRNAAISNVPRSAHTPSSTIRPPMMITAPEISTAQRAAGSPLDRAYLLSGSTLRKWLTPELRKIATYSIRPTRTTTSMRSVLSWVAHADYLRRYVATVGRSTGFDKPSETRQDRHNFPRLAQQGGGGRTGRVHRREARASGRERANFPEIVASGSTGDHDFREVVPILG